MHAPQADDTSLSCRLPLSRQKHDHARLYRYISSKVRIAHWCDTITIIHLASPTSLLVRPLPHPSGDVHVRLGKHRTCAFLADPGYFTVQSVNHGAVGGESQRCPVCVRPCQLRCQFARDASPPTSTAAAAATLTNVGALCCGGFPCFPGVLSPDLAVEVELEEDGKRSV